MIKKMGWMWGSEAGPQPISLKGQKCDGDESDGVEASAPLCSAHWTIEHEGRKNVSYTDYDK